MRFANIVINTLRLVRSFRPRSILPYLGVIFLAVLVWKVDAQNLYEFSGVYRVSEILPTYCTNCALSLPSEYLETQVVLSVRSDKRNELWNALKQASLANGWLLTKQGNTIRATRQEDKGRVFVSCIDSLVYRVATDEYLYRLRSDSLKCASRDSVRRLADSLRALPAPSLPSPLGFQNYRLEYVAYNKSFSDKMGFEWKRVLASGNLKSMPSFYDSWQLWAVENNDTNFTRRTLEFAIDSTISIDWGNERQVPEKTYSQDGGIVATNYEWRKYGISISVRRDGQRVSLEYMVRNEDNGTLNGKAVGLSGDTLATNGTYRLTQDLSEGLPLLSRLPLVGALFSVKQTITDYKHFEIRLFPQLNTSDTEARQ